MTDERVTRAEIDELVDLALCVGAWIAFGRLNRVFDVDGACRVGAPLPG